MKKNKEKLYLLIFGICLIISIIIEFSLFIDMSKLMASINGVDNNDEYKTYEQLEAVFFNPVDYKWCDHYSKSDNCYLWYVLKEETNGKLSLVYGELNDDWKNHKENKLETINDITSSWSDKLKIETEYKVEDAYSATQGPGKANLDFTGQKARYLFDTDLTSDFVKLIGSNIAYWYGGDDISKNVPIIFINTTEGGNFTGITEKFSGILTKYENKNPAAPIDYAISNLWLLPVIEVEKEPINNNDVISNVVYLDPTNLEKKCTKEEAESNLNAYGSPTEVKTGCMKWYSFDKDSNGVHKLILDHNTTAKTGHPEYVINPGTDVESAPGRKALTDLVNLFNWQVTPRLISVEEISKITDHENFDTDALSEGYFIEIPGDHFITYPSYYKSTKKYSYLFDYVARATTGGNSGDGPGKINELYDYISYSTGCTWLNYCSDYPDGIDPDGGASMDPNNPRYAPSTLGVLGYWTSTKATAYSGNGHDPQYWLIEGDYSGLNFEDYKQDWGFGIRPVIEVELKNKVTYNDEGRITTKQVIRGDKAENISSQGKEDYVFKYWSLDKKTPFDFSTHITDDITLYAVYSHQICTSKTYSQGQVLYFDPVSEEACNENTFSIEKVKNNQSTCYKWIVISTDDSSEKEKITIQLDHNLFQTPWINSDDVSEIMNIRSVSSDYATDNSIGPMTALKNLSQATQSWVRVPLLNYELDTSDAIPTDENKLGRTNYGKLVCNNGTCVNGHNETLATNVRARMITMQEIKKLYNKNMGESTPISTTSKNMGQWIATSDSDNYYYSSESRLGNTNLYWLSENLIWVSSDVGITHEDYYGICTDNRYCYYWTMNPIASNFHFHWGIHSDGYATNLSISSHTSNNDLTGVRPVIEIEKEKDCEDAALVIYNDENRITKKSVKLGEKTTEIDSQGKEGHTFKYWSLDNENEFDFNTPINEDKTLYAVYEINKFDVKFIDGEEELNNIKVEYKDKIPASEIPKITKEGYTFKYWSLDKENEFDFDEKITEDKTLYAVYEEEKQEDECILSIESFMYKINHQNLTISNVPQDATNEDIMNNLTITAQEKKIENDVVIIRCNDEIKEYKINRTWIPKTGQMLIKTFPLIGYISIIIVLLMAINKQREKNKRLRK